MSTSVAAVACSDLPGMKNDSFSFLLLLLLPCEGCPKQVVDRNIYHHVTKIQQPDWPLATCATPNMSTLAAEEVACAGAGAGATGSSSCSASTELILHLHVSMQHSGYQSGVALGSKTLVSATQIIHNIPQVYHVPSPPKYVHVPVPGPKIDKVAGGRAPASAVDVVHGSCRRASRSITCARGHYQQGRSLSRQGASPGAVPSADCSTAILHSMSPAGHHRQEALHRESSGPP